MKNEGRLTVGKVLLVYEISRQVLPTAPSPTVTHFMNLEALIFQPSTQSPSIKIERNASDLHLRTEPITHSLEPFLRSCCSCSWLCFNYASVLYKCKMNTPQRTEPSSFATNSYSSSSSQRQRKTKTESFLQSWFYVSKDWHRENMKMQQQRKHFKDKVRKFETLTLFGELQSCWWRMRIKERETAKMKTHETFFAGKFCS